MVTIFIIVVIVIAIPMIIAASSEASEKEDANRKAQERRFTHTGFSSFTFKLKGSNYCSDLAKEFLKEIKEGDAVVLMPEFFNEYDKYAISVRLFGRNIGYVDRTAAYHWAEKLFGGSAPNYRLCVAKKVTLNEGFDYPVVDFEVFYKDHEGTAKFNFKHGGPDYIYVDPIEGCGKDMAEDIVKRHFLFSEVSREMVYTHPEWYGLDDDTDGGDDLNEKWHEEDVQHLKQFIFDLYSGLFVDVKAKSKFLKQVAMNRIYGNNEKLEKLLDRYLEFKELKLK